MTLFAVALFFGYFIENGTIQWLAQSILYKLRNYPKALPFIFFLVAYVLGAIGGANMVVFSAALAYPVGKASGLKAHETGAICYLGTVSGSYMPWSQHGATFRAIIEGMNDGIWADTAMTINWKASFLALIAYLIIVFVYYIVFKNYKLNKISGVSKPDPATPIQKKSVFMIGLLLFIMIVPSTLNKMIDSAFLATVTSYCNITLVCLVGAVINLILGLSDETAVIKKRIPWNVLTMIFGMGMLVGMGSELGVIEYLGELAQNIPPMLVAPVFILIGGTMSLFSSSLSVVYPTLLPIIGALAVKTGLDPTMCFTVILIGAATPGMSPLSAGGAMMLSACTEEIVSAQEIFNKLFLIAFASMGILLILSFLQFFSIL